VADSTFTHYDLLGVADFKVMLDNDLVWEPGVEKPQKAANLWLSHQARRTYANGMAMFPDNKPHDGYFNTWAGLSMNPAEGDCSLILQHIHKVICDSDDEIYEWVMDWCADMVQDPGNPKGCALILKGQEGTGKGMFAEMMAAYFGAHYRHIIDESHYTGNFNAHMMDAVFVFLDEVTFGGNIKTSGKIKGLVSEKVLLGERKGIDAVTYRNMAHVLIASNEKWVIPAGSNSRRWTVLEVNPDRATDIDYFKDLRHQMDNGGLEAFLFVLLGRELKENIRTAPHTVALQEQRDLSASSDSISQFWIYCVETDMQCLNNNACEANVKDEPSNIAKVDLYREYKDFCDSHTLRAVQLIPFCSEAKKIGFIEVRFTVNKNRIRGYAMPTPRAFAMAIGHYEEVL
jgi:hypothetical protein